MLGGNVKAFGTLLRPLQEVRPESQEPPAPDDRVATIGKTHSIDFFTIVNYIKFCFYNGNTINKLFCIENYINLSFYNSNTFN